MSSLSNHATTVATDRAGITRVTYHKTAIVAVDRAEGTVTLDSGGWRTYTTKLKMNQAAENLSLPFDVIQRNGIWLVYTPDSDVPTPFEDGMVIGL